MAYLKKIVEFDIDKEHFIVEFDDTYKKNNDGEIVFVRNEKYGIILDKMDFFCLVSWLYLAQRNVEIISERKQTGLPVECARKQVGESLLVVDCLEDSVRVSYLWQMQLTKNSFFNYVSKLMQSMDDIVGVENFKCEYYDPIFLANDAYKDVYVLEKIVLDNVPVGDLLISDKKEYEDEKLVPIAEGRVYEALEGDADRVLRWEQINYWGLDNKSRVLEMYQRISEEGYMPEKYGAYIVLSENTSWIRDGSHRAACILKKFGNIDVKVARWYRRGGMRAKDVAFLKRIGRTAKHKLDKTKYSKPRILVYGTGDNFKCYYPWINNRYDIIGVVDSDTRKIGTDIRGFCIEGLSTIRNKDYDFVLITPNAYLEIRRKLITLGVKPDKIIILHDVSQASVGKDFVSICFYLRGNVSDCLLNINYILGFYKKICNTQCFLDIAVDSNADFMREVCEVNSMSSVIRDVRVGIGDDKNKYDIIIGIDSRYPEILQAKENRLVRLLPEAIEYIMQCRKFKIMNNRYFQSYNSAYVSSNETSGCYEQLFSRKRINQPDIYNFLSMGDASYLPCEVASSKILKYGLEPRKFITLHTGLFKNRFSNARIRTWPEGEFSTLIGLLKENYPDYKILLIKHAGLTKIDTRNVDLIIDEDVNYEDMKAFMKYAALHVDSDDFLVHLRHLLGGGKSAVVFGPTSDKFYGYAENINLRDNKCSITCEGVSSDWEIRCMKSMGHHALCMQEVKARQVFDRIEASGGIVG